MFCYGVKIAKKGRILTLKFEYQSRVPVQFLKVSIKDIKRCGYLGNFIKESSKTLIIHKEK